MNILEARRILNQQKQELARRKVKEEKEKEICELLSIILKDRGVHGCSMALFNENGEIIVWTRIEYRELVPDTFEGYAVKWSAVSKGGGHDYF